MKARLLKGGVQLFALFAGCAGAIWIWLGLIIIMDESFFGFFFLPFGVYPVWVACITFLRFSPRAVDHVCILFGVALFALAPSFIFQMGSGAGDTVAGYIWLFLAIWVAVSLSKYIKFELFYQYPPGIIVRPVKLRSVGIPALALAAAGLLGHWMGPSGVGDYRDSPDGIWRAHASNLTRRTWTMRRERYLEFKLEKKEGGFRIEQRRGYSEGDVAPDYSDRSIRHINWSPDSARVAISSVNGSVETIEVPTGEATTKESE